MKNKSTAIVTAFSILVFVVLGIVIYQAYKKQTDGLTSSSFIETREDVISRKKPEPRSIELASKDNKPLVIKGIRVDSTDSKPSTTTKDNDKSNSPQLSTIEINAEAINRPAIDPNVSTGTSTNQKTFTYVAPTPVVSNPIQEQAPYVAPLEKTRLQSYQEAMNRLKSRGSEIVIPVMNNNNSLLSITADSDVYNVLSYEYELNADKKGYAGFGSKTHIDTLKCERYISSCKTILTQYPNGRYYVVLANVELYSR